MKWLYFFVSFLLGNSLQAQVDDYTFHTLYRTFEEGSQQLILRDSSLLKTAPALVATTLQVLPIGTTIQVLERMDERTTIKGFLTNWYRVQTQQSGKLIEGFVWGGNIAVGSHIGRDTSVRFMYGVAAIELIDRGDYQDPSILLEINACKGNQLLDQLTTTAAGTIYTQTQIRATGNRGIRGIQEVLELAFSDGYCGGVSAEIVIFWTGRKLRFIKLLSQGFSDKNFARQLLVYPADEGGQSQTILFKRQIGIISTQKREKITEQATIIYGWNGLELIKVGA